MSPPDHFMAKVLTLLPKNRQTWRGWLVYYKERIALKPHSENQFILKISSR